MQAITTLKGLRTTLYGAKCFRRVINYVSIPKCSSTIYRSSLYGLAQAGVKNKILPGEWFTIIRNPYTRCISGIKEYNKRVLKKRNLTVEDYDWHLANMLEDISEYDEHLEPQLYFLNQVPEGVGVRLFDFDRDQPDAVTEWIGSPLLKAKLNKPPQTDISVYNQDLLEAVVTKYYAADLSLYHSVIRTDAAAYWYKD